MNLLFISHILPTFDRDSGSFRLYQIIRICRRLGHSVTFIAHSAAGDVDPMPYIRKLEDLGVTVYPVDPAKLRGSGAVVDMPDLDYPKLFNDGNFDVAYLYFFIVARQHIEDIRTLSPRTRIIIDSVDVHFLREQRRADLANDDTLRVQAQQTKAVELATYCLADAVITVTEDDRKELLRASPQLQVDVIPNVHPIQDISKSFGERSGLLFVGNFPHPPNVDAVLYFHKDIWPHVTSRLPDAKLYLVGNEPLEAVQALAGGNVLVTGFVPDTRPYLSQCRISIAPLRYGAGMKGKVGEALAAGLPVVATSVANEGFGLEPGREILVADDPIAFADAVVQLYHDEEAWKELAANGKEFMSRHYSPEVVTAKIGESLAAVAIPTDVRRQIGSLNQAVIARDEQIAELNRLVRDKDVHVDNLGQLLAERDRVVHTLLASASWRITRPLRDMKSWIKRHRR